MMILVCPECSTNYEIPNALPDAGAKVRCTTCEHIWLATPADTFDPADRVEEQSGDDGLAEAAEAGAETDAETESAGESDADGVDELSPFDEEIPAIAPGVEDFDELDFSDAVTEENSQSDVDDLFAAPGEEEEPATGDETLASLFDEDTDLGADTGSETGEDKPEVEAAAEPDGEAEAQGEDGGNSQDDIDGLFDEPDDDNSQDDIDGMFDAKGREDEADGDDGNNQDDIDGLIDEAEATGDEDQSQDDVDGLFEEKIEIAAASEDEAGKDSDSKDSTSDDSASNESADDDDELVDPFDGADFGEEENPVKALDDAVVLPIWKRVDQQAVVGWSCYAIALVLVVVLAVSLRVHVVRVAPAMASIYKALGMPVNVRGVMFTNVQQRWQPNGGKLQLQVEGEIANLTNNYKTLPHIVVGALSEDRREVFRWVVNVRKKPLLPGEKAPFIAEIPAPPELARHLVLRFED